jgi:hypothetical protein
MFKSISHHIHSLIREFESLNSSWLPSEELEKVYTPTLVDALHQFKASQQQSPDADVFAIIKTIFSEVSKVDYKGEFRCYDNFLRMQSSSIVNIYQALEFFEMDFKVLYHHPDGDNIVLFYSLLLKNAAFSENLAKLLLKKNATSAFKKIVDFLHKNNVIPLIKQFIRFQNLEDLELISKILEICEHSKLVQNNQIEQLISAITCHPAIDELHTASHLARNHQSNIPENLALIMQHKHPLKLIHALIFLEKFKLRTPKIAQALISKKEPQQFAELINFLSQQQLLDDVFLDSLSELSFQHFYLNYYQNPNLKAEEKYKGLFQAIAYYKISKKEFN